MLGRMTYEQLSAWANGGPSDNPEEEQLRAAVRILLLHLQTYPQDIHLPLYSHHEKRLEILCRFVLGLHDLLADMYAGFSSLSLNYQQWEYAVRLVQDAYVLQLAVV